MRAERSLTKEHCQELRQGGALSIALGVESASPRVLSLIDKGIPIEVMKEVIENMAEAQIAVEAMCFSDFPTETFQDAMTTIRFIEQTKDNLALFILGRFDLSHGSKVAHNPHAYDLHSPWHVAGDELMTGLFYKEKKATRTDQEQQKLESALDRLSLHWKLGHYPWAGALSTAHSMLWFDHHGPKAFRSSSNHPPSLPHARREAASARFDVERVTETSSQREAEIWEQLVYVKQRVSPQLYREFADALPHAPPKPARWEYMAGEMPQKKRAP